MPMFLDHHKIVPPPAMVEESRKAIKAGAKSPQGVKGVNGFYSSTESWCLTEAPNAKAVHDYHDAMGIKMGPGDVTEVKSIV
ncbi:MAG: hypothetical protein HY532_03840 [Chloroflexi bacterium]|nr:hypothetical protein [Chloroflexota bacterium]MBI4202230.1 hypothetical protein [Chloroflexota bacterium]